MMSNPVPKKNETIEVRVADTTKAAFMAQCARDGASASDMIRGFIDARLNAASTSRQHRASAWRMAIAGLLGVMLGVGATAPSLAHGVPLTHPTFAQLDRNHDGLLTPQEYRAQP
jgi:hypothetical protein